MDSSNKCKFLAHPSVVLFPVCRMEAEEHSPLNQVHQSDGNTVAVIIATKNLKDQDNN